MTFISERICSTLDQGPKVFLNSLPKSGTHFLLSILELTGLKLQKPVLSRGLQRHPLNHIHFWERETSLIGIGQPSEVKTATLRHIFSRLQAGNFLVGHVPYQEGIRTLLHSACIRTILLVRDPRDVIISQVHYILKEESHFLHHHYKTLQTDKERYITSILGVRHKQNNPKTLGIAEKLDSILSWQQVDSVLMLRFEDLIGHQGGGDSDIQKERIMAIGDHIGIKIEETPARYIGKRAFGQGGTYRKGHIGEWRQVFDDEVKDLFRKKAGAHLIKMGYELDCQK